MAVLKNILDNTRITFTLSPNYVLHECIGYDLNVSANQNGETSEILKIYSDSTRIFSYKEVRLISDSFGSLERGDINHFIFEPEYNKDFCLELEAIRSTMGDHFKVRLFMDQARKYSTSGIQMYVTSEDLSSFKSEFESEYFNAMRENKIDEARFEAEYATQKLEEKLKSQIIAMPCSQMAVEKTGNLINLEQN